MWRLYGLCLLFFFSFGIWCPIVPEPFVEKTIFSPFDHLSKISWLCLCRSISRFSILFYSFACFFANIEQSRFLGLCFVHIVLTILGLFFLHINVRIIWLIFRKQLSGILIVIPFYLYNLVRSWIEVMSSDIHDLFSILEEKHKVFHH